MKRIKQFFIIMGIIFLCISLHAKIIVLDNFDDGNALTLYGKGEIGITADYQEAVPGNSIITKLADPNNDHTKGSGFSLKLENVIVDQYAGVYINVTENSNVYSYIDASQYKQFSCFLKASPGSADWLIEFKDSTNAKATLSLGSIPAVWNQYTFNLAENTNICNYINIKQIKTIILINKTSGSSGHLWIDDMVFDDLQNVESQLFNNEVQIGFSGYKIDNQNLYTKISVNMLYTGRIEINIYDKNGVLVSNVNTGNKVYEANTVHSFDWYGKNQAEFLRNGLYMVRVKVVCNNKTARLVKPVGIFR